MWRSLVSRLNGVQEASSSNLDTRTKTENRKVFGLFLYPEDQISAEVVMKIGLNIICSGRLYYFVSCTVELWCHAAHLLETAGEIALIGVTEGVTDLTDTVCGLAQLPLGIGN